MASIEDAFGSFNPSLDPRGLDLEAATRAREVLQSALAALDEPGVQVEGPQEVEA